MTRKTVLRGPLMAGLVLAAAATSAAAQEAGAIASPLDRGFAAEAAASNTFEIESSRMALRKSRDPEVRAMARWMVRSHTEAQRKLQAAAAYAAPEAAAPARTPMTEDMLMALSGVEGAEFDRAYVDDQVKAHQLTATKLADYRQTGAFGPLLRWDAETAPEVAAHLAHFEALSGRL